MNVDAYLKRIEYHGSLRPNFQTLTALQQAHLLTVPFENLSIHNNELIVLDKEALFDKIITRHRGGFCYELNGLFGVLLQEVGFDVAMLAAEVVRGDGSFGPIFDHMTLLVTLDERWLIDVGFGDSFREPLQLDSREEQVQFGRKYRIGLDNDTYTLMERKHGEAWQPQCRFDDQPHQLHEYEGMCHYHQTSPQSHFTQKRVCTLATPEGRITLSNLRFITTKLNGDRHERPIDEAEFTTLLRSKFSVDLEFPPFAKVETLDAYA